MATTATDVLSLMTQEEYEQQRAFAQRNAAAHKLLAQRIEDLEQRVDSLLRRVDVQQQISRQHTAAGQQHDERLDARVSALEHEKETILDGLTEVSHLLAEIRTDQLQANTRKATPQDSGLKRMLAAAKRKGGKR